MWRMSRQDRCLPCPSADPFINFKWAYLSRPHSFLVTCWRASRCLTSLLSWSLCHLSLPHLFAPIVSPFFVCVCWVSGLAVHWDTIHFFVCVFLILTLKLYLFNTFHYFLCDIFPDTARPASFDMHSPSSFALPKDFPLFLFFFFHKIRHILHL